MGQKHCATIMCNGAIGGNGQRLFTLSSLDTLPPQVCGGGGRLGWFRVGLRLLGRGQGPSCRPEGNSICPVLHYVPFLFSDVHQLPRWYGSVVTHRQPDGLMWDKCKSFFAYFWLAFWPPCLHWIQCMCSQHDCIRYNGGNTVGQKNSTCTFQICKPFQGNGVVCNVRLYQKANQK